MAEAATDRSYPVSVATPASASNVSIGFEGANVVQEGLRASPGDFVLDRGAPKSLDLDHARVAGFGLDCGAASSGGTLWAVDPTPAPARNVSNTARQSKRTHARIRIETGP